MSVYRSITVIKWNSPAQKKDMFPRQHLSQGWHYFVSMRRPPTSGLRGIGRNFREEITSSCNQTKSLRLGSPTTTEGEGTKPYCLVMDRFWPSRIGNWILLSICRETEAANRLLTLIRSSYRINDFDFLGVDSALAFSQTQREQRKKRDCEIS